jgi:hypothetical protein
VRPSADGGTTGRVRSGSGVGRLLAPVRFPLVAFALWRSAHGAALAAFGGVSASSEPDAFQPSAYPGFFVWDAAWYERILNHGYEPIPNLDEQPAAFFPLLSWLTWLVRLVVRDELVAAVVVTSVAGLAAIVLVYLVVREWRGESVARWTVALLLAFPTSLFLWNFYTEGLLIALSAGAALAYGRGRPEVAGVLAGLAAMTRPPGVLVAVALAVAHVVEHGRDRRVLWYLLGPVGLVPVVVAQHIQAGDGLAWVRIQGAWHRELAAPLVPVGQFLWDQLGDIATGDADLLARASREGTWLDLLAAVLFVALAVAAFRQRWPWVASLLIVVFVAVAVSYSPLAGASRYVLAAWPAFAVLADGAGRVRHARPALVGAFALVTVTALASLSDGEFVA